MIKWERKVETPMGAGGSQEIKLRVGELDLLNYYFLPTPHF